MPSTLEAKDTATPGADLNGWCGMLGRPLERIAHRLHPGTGETAGYVVRAYILALFLIALSFVGAFALATWSIGAQRDAAQAIVIASQQDVRANRIAGLSRLLASRPDGPDSARDRRRLLDAIEALERDHRTLHATAGQGAERDVMEAEPHALDRRVREFLADARLVDETGDKVALKRMAGAVRGGMGAGFAAFADLKRDHAAAVDRRMHVHHALLLFVSLGLLVVEARFIFMPLLGLLGRIETKLKAREEELTFQSRHDELTGLPNRRALGEYVGALRTVDTTMRDDRPSLRRCVVAIDLDNFKRVNDRHGHAAGDDMLRAVSGALLRSVREADRAFRIGGDEFVVVINETRSTEDWSEGMMTAIGRMARHVRAAVDGDPRFAGASASFGYREFHADEADTFETVLADADAALYRAKTDGKDRVVRSGRRRPRRAGG